MKTRGLKRYVGIRHDGQYEDFTADYCQRCGFANPTQATHGHLYGAVIGPFRTKRGAQFMAKHGRSNPHLQTVDDAERIAKQA